MHRALIFNGVIAMVAVAFILPLQGKQDRKRLDEEKMRVGQQFRLAKESREQTSTLI